MAGRRDEYAARLDLLSAVLMKDTEPGETVGEMLDAVTDIDARTLLAHCVVVLTAPDDAPDVTEVDRAHAAAWLHRGLWTHSRNNPSLADLLALVSPVLPWPE